MTSDQKRALTIGGIGIGGLLLWRRMHGAATTSRTTPVSTTSQIAPYTPQAPVTLQAGESIYDPNSEALLTTPTPVDTSSAIAGAGNQSSAAAAPSYSINVTYPQTVRMVKPTRKPAKRTVKKPATKGKVKHA